MAQLVIRITPETALYLLKEVIKDYQGSEGVYPRVRTYIMYMIFMVKAMKNGWRSVDNSYTITALLLAPSSTDSRERGELYSCKVAYYREGVSPVDTFYFPADPYYSKMLYQYYISERNKGTKIQATPIKLRATRDIEHLVDIRDIVLKNYGDYS